MQTLSYEEISSSIKKIDGHLVPGQEKVLFDLATSLSENALIVEIGSFKGKSTCCFGYACLGTKRRVVAIDLFRFNQTNRGFHHSDYFDIFLNNVQKNGLENYVTPLQGNSKEIAKDWSDPIDLIFIDGSHEYKHAMADFRNFIPFVKPQGIVAIHDVIFTRPGPLYVWVKIARHHLTDLRAFDSLAYGRKPSQKSSAITDTNVRPQAEALCFWAEQLLKINDF